MANHVMLNNVDHKDLRIITTRSAKYGDNIRCAMTFSWEFRSVQAHYPIFFSKDEGSGKFMAVGMFGFEENENLFLDENGWGAAYIPMMVLRDPFLIGRQQPADGDESTEGSMVHLDMDSPRVNNSEGERVFLPHGGVSEYLESVNGLLHTINEGFAVDQLFLEALENHELLESFALDITLNDGSDNRLSGFYTIDEEKLAGLSSEALAGLHEKAFLQPIYMAIASLSNIRALIDRKNARVAAAG